MSTHAWLHTLRQLCDEFDSLTATIEQGPTIELSINPKQSESGWVLVLKEIWPSYINLDYTADIGKEKIKERSEWIDKQLKRQTNCARADSGAWTFKNRHDAEKFITLYYLTWAK